MPNYYLIIECAQIRRRQVKPQINLIPYAMGCIFQSLQKLAFIIFVGSSFSMYRNMCTHENRPSKILIIWWRIFQDSYWFSLFLLPIFKPLWQFLHDQGKEMVCKSINQSINQPVNQSIPFFIHCNFNDGCSLALHWHGY